MKIYKGMFKVKKIGGSLYLLLDKNIRNILEVEDGIMLGGKLYNLALKNIKCIKCEYEFQDLDNAEVYDCPCCGHEMLEYQADDNLVRVEESDEEKEITDTKEGE